MAKGQKRSSKEAKKPKANKPKTSVSDYKKSVIASGHKLRAISAQRPCRGTQRPVRRERARRSVRLRGDLVSYVERNPVQHVRREGVDKSSSTFVRLLSRSGKRARSARGGAYDASLRLADQSERASAKARDCQPLCHRFTRHAPSPKEPASGFLAFPAPCPPTDA